MGSFKNVPALFFWLLVKKAASLLPLVSKIGIEVCEAVIRDLLKGCRDMKEISGMKMREDSELCIK